MTTDTTFELPKLGYAYDALDPAYSAEILELHHSKHHKAYVDAANTTLAALAECREKNDFDRLKQLQKDLAFNVSGHALHALFWQNIAPSNESTAPDDLALAVAKGFGSFDAFREQFLAAGTSIQGSGWAALCWEPASGSLIVEQILDHQDNHSCGSQPILVMDMWEHAFYLQFKNEKKKWAKAFWELVNWQDVNSRVMQAQKITFLPN